MHRFGQAGWQVVEGFEADLHVINTCTVTHIADRKSRHLVRQIRKQNPKAMIVATGCYAQLCPQALRETGADIVVPNSEKDDILTLLSRKANIVTKEISDRAGNSVRCRTRSFIKIQDGCQQFCTYCIVPYVRNGQKYYPADDIIRTVQERGNKGYQEIVLTGTRIGSYRYEKCDLADLIERILKETPIRRVHLSSLQPQEVSPRLLNLWRDIRMIRHFHLALQSGSQSILERMGRKYSLDEYRGAVELIRRYVPDASITTDVMVGFPGETEEEFAESRRFCQEIRFADIHVFIYSSRPGTAAARMPNQVNTVLKKQRSASMLTLAEASAGSFRKQFIGRQGEVLFEGKIANTQDIYSGFNQNYVRVYMRSAVPLENVIRPVRFLSEYKDGLWGEAL